MKKLSILFTLALSLNIYAVGTLEAVERELWEMNSRNIEATHLQKLLKHQWSEELEISVKRLEG